MNKDDLIFLLGTIITELGGEVKISADSQIEFTKGMTQKELLFKEDVDKTITIKLVDKEEVKDSCLDCGMEIGEDDIHYCEVVQPIEETEEN